MPPDKDRGRPGGATSESMRDGDGHGQDTPYASQAFAYHRAGWRGVLPLPRSAKSPPPDGYTGRAGAWPSAADIQT